MLKQNALQGSVSSRAKTRSRVIQRSAPICHRLSSSDPTGSENPESNWATAAGGGRGRRAGAVPAEKDFQTPSCDRQAGYAAPHSLYTSITTSGTQQHQQNPPLSLIDAPWKHNSGFGLIHQSTAVVEPEARLSAPGGRRDARVPFVNVSKIVSC